MTAKMIINKLGTLILIAMILGIAVGLALGETAQIFAPIGDLFMQLIKMVVVPMVLFSLIGGAASLGNSSSAGKIGLLTFYLLYNYYYHCYCYRSYFQCSI